jgi:hypothetical protein
MSSATVREEENALQEPPNAPPRRPKRVRYTNGGSPISMRVPSSTPAPYPSSSSAQLPSATPLLDFVRAYDANVDALEAEYERNLPPGTTSQTIPAPDSNYEDAINSARRERANMAIWAAAKVARENSEEVVASPPRDEGDRALDEEYALSFRSWDWELVGRMSTQFWGL